MNSRNFTDLPQRVVNQQPKIDVDYLSNPLIIIFKLFSRLTDIALIALPDPNSGVLPLTIFAFGLEGLGLTIHFLVRGAYR
jgi:hypothetical protein